MKKFFSLSATGVSNTFRNTVKLVSSEQQAVYPFVHFVPFPSTSFVNGQDLTLSNLKCDNQCKQTVTCLGYSSNQDNCKLQSIDSNLTNIPGMTSYFRVQSKREYLVFSFLDFPKSSALVFYNGNRNECQQACDSLTGCIGFVNYLKF